MTPQQKGRFCAACQKTVVDFTEMSDRQVADYFKKAKNVCGRFNSSQLGREIALQPRSVPWARPFLPLTLSAFLLTLESSAQSETKPKVAVCALPEKGKIKELPEADAASDFLLKGRVVDVETRPVAYATVMLEGTNLGTQADSNGFFRLRHSKSQKATVIISAVGYESKTVALDANDTAEVPLVMVTQQLAGAVVVTVGFVGVKKKKAPAIPLLPTIKAEPPFSKFSVFPNPASHGATITVDALTIKNGNYQLAIVNALGVVVQTNEVLFDKGIKRAAISLKEMPAGQYFVQLTRRASGKVYTEAIAVQ